jgi:hypothetical protein
MFVVFDLDGTLADCEHRIHHIRMPQSVGADYPKQDWRAFYAACKDDSPIWPLMATMEALIRAGHRIEIWTGRSDECRADTEMWLDQYMDRPARDRPFVRMRAAGDHTADHKLKLSWLREADWKPDLIFEDRASVVAMWRAEGIICAQVAPGNF